MRPNLRFDSELTDLAGQAEENVARAEALVAGLTAAQFNWQPAPGVWSIAQCLLHLNVVNGQDVPLMEAVINEARRRGITGVGPFRYSWLMRKWVASLEPPPKYKTRAPKVYVPPAQAEPAATIEQYRTTNRQIQALIQTAEGLHLARVKMPTPVVNWLKMPLGARFALIMAHDRRHLWQAEQVRANREFLRG